MSVQSYIKYTVNLLFLKTNVKIEKSLMIMASANKCPIKMNIQQQLPDLASRPNFYHEKVVAIDIIICIAKFQKTNQVRE